MARIDTKNSTHYWEDRHIPGLSLLRADLTTLEYAPHTHEAFVIAVTEIGGAEIRNHGRLARVHASTLFVSNPMEPQSARLAGSRRWCYRSFYIAQPAIDAIARGLGIEALPCFRRSIVNDPELIGGLLSLHWALEDGGGLFRTSELLIGSLGRLFERHGSGGQRVEQAPRDRTILRMVVDLVRERHAGPLHLEQLSKAAGLTPFQLIGLFKATVGLTPHAYLTQVRLNAACRHLRLGVPIAEAATASGFYDQSALTRHFKRSYGMTPLQFVRAATT